MPAPPPRAAHKAVPPRSVPVRWYTCLRAPRAERREPPADRARAAAAGARAERAHGRDGRRQDGARPRARPAARRPRRAGGIQLSARAPRRPTSRASSSCPTRFAQSSPSGCPTDAEEIVLARRLGSDGRTRAYLNGRSATVSELREIGSRLVSFYGQHEHRKLTLAGAQLEILDAFCGPDHALRLRACAKTFAELRALAAELDSLRELSAARERELDLLEHELSEIDAAGLDQRGVRRAARRARSPGPSRRAAPRRRRRRRRACARRCLRRPRRLAADGRAPPAAWTRSPASTHAWMRSPSGCARS